MCVGEDTQYRINKTMSDGAQCDNEQQKRQRMVVGEGLPI